MLKKIRIILAAIFFTGITLLFLDITGSLHAWLGWMAKIQFLPAVLAANAVVTAALILITVLSGRIYCAVICPLGIMQDIISWINGKIKIKNRFRFSYKPEYKWIRYTFLALFLVTLAAGAHSVAALIAPYSAYGRIASSLFAPIYQWGNNILAWIAERADSYAFYEKEVWIRSIHVSVTALMTFALLFIMAWKGGRTYCNTVCPVGTILGIFSRRSIFAPVIDKDKCSNCRLCERQCRSSCIDIASHSIDHSRCVACMDCIAMCKDRAIKFTNTLTKHETNQKKETDTGRRSFIATAVITGGAVTAQANGIIRQDRQQRHRPIVPAGSASLKNFTDHCTACQLCVSTCQNNVLSPSSSLDTLMQPEMSFKEGYCRPECTACSQVCPTGAIRPISIEEKSSIQTGHAVVNLDLCVVNTDGVTCGNCSRHCPSEAIIMVNKDESHLVPAVDEEKCIGCGACEYLCPARPVKAIHVEGHLVHKMI